MKGEAELRDSSQQGVLTSWAMHHSDRCHQEGLSAPSMYPRSHKEKRQEAILNYSWEETPEETAFLYMRPGNLGSEGRAGVRLLADSNTGKWGPAHP